MKKYLGIFIIIFLLSAIGLSIYQEATKEPISVKANRLSCQKELTTFEKVLDKSKITIAQQLLQSGNITLSSDIWKSIHAKSQLFNYISKEDIEQLTKKIINSKKITNKVDDKILSINFYTRENDREDPNKKSDNCKLYAGYLVYEFRLENQLIYKIQTDFMSFQGKDIPARIECVFNSFLSIK